MSTEGLHAKIIQINHSKWRFFMKTKELYTKKLYWHDTYLFKHNSIIIETGCDEEKGHWVRLNETIFHPQGGGQPNDEGTINDIKITKVEESREVPEGIDYDLSLMTHYLECDPKLSVGDKVTIAIDKEIRLRNSALHTAGHIIAGLMRTEFKYKQQTGANHFPDQAKVEFKKDGDDFSQEILEYDALNIIKEGREVTEKFEEVPLEHRHPSRGIHARCVTITNLWKEPCSGTHLNKTSEIIDFVIRNKKQVKDKISVGYSAHYGLFKKEVLSTFQEAQIPKKEEDNYKKHIETPNGTQVIFFLSKGSINAVVISRDGKKDKISHEQIYINLDNSADKSIVLSKKDLDWQKLALDRIKEVSLAFSQHVVITQLTDWSFNNSQQCKLTT